MIERALAEDKPEMRFQSRGGKGVMCKRQSNRTWSAALVCDGLYV